MAYITFAGLPQALGVGRTAYDGAINPITDEYVCEVEEVRDGEKETTAEHHATVKQVAEVEAQKPPAPAFVPRVKG